jgi:DNA polymerase
MHGMSPDPNSARILRQTLEAWSAAGITQLPPSPPLSLASMSGNASSAPAASVEQKPAMAPPLVAADEPAANRSTANSSTANLTEADLTETDMPRRTSRLEREAGLAVLQKQVAECRRCEELASTRTQTVFGVGNPLARILFVGEAPGADEDKQGEPFVGRAGQLLTRIIEACKLARDDIYIANILKCRPPNNRTPLPDECGNCREYLDGQIKIIDPDYIVCWGTVAAQNLLGQTTLISRLRGRFFQHGRAKVLCTFHPSYLLRNPAAKKDVWIDMQFLFADMGIDLLAGGSPR